MGVGTLSVLITGGRNPGTTKSVPTVATTWSKESSKGIGRLNKVVVSGPREVGEITILTGRSLQRKEGNNNIVEERTKDVA